MIEETCSLGEPFDLGPGESREIDVPLAISKDGIVSLDGRVLAPGRYEFSICLSYDYRKWPWPLPAVIVHETMTQRFCLQVWDGWPFAVAEEVGSPMTDRI